MDLLHDFHILLTSWSSIVHSLSVGIFAHFGGSLEQSAAVIVIDMERDSEDSNKFRVFIESSLRNFSDSLVGFTIIQRKEIVNSVMDSVEYKGLKRLTWPGQHCTDRQKQKFYKQLQLRLPKPHCPSHEGVINGERTSLLVHWHTDVHCIYCPVEISDIHEHLLNFAINVKVFFFIWIFYLQRFFFLLRGKLVHLSLIRKHLKFYTILLKFKIEQIIL